MLASPSASARRPIVVIVTGQLVPCRVTTQSSPTRRVWLSIVPEIRVRRISATRFIAAAAAATRRNRLESSVAPVNPPSYSSAMKAVVMLPDAKRGWSITAEQKGRL